MTYGYLVLVLHAHLPYVLGYGRWPHGAEWLYEATCETYIPLLNLLNRLSRKGKKAGFTVGLTPILCEMLASNVFKMEFKDYIRHKIEAAGKDRIRFTGPGEGEKAALADRWVTFYESALQDFTVIYKEDLIEAFRKFQDRHQIELITSSATHAYLPLISHDSAISAQIRQGIDSYRSFFGSRPKGIWLPECGYRPAFSSPPIKSDNGHPAYRKGVEEILAENGIQYFFLDTHLLGAGRPIDESRLSPPETFDPPDRTDPADAVSSGSYCCGSLGYTEAQPELQEQKQRTFRQPSATESDNLAPHSAGSPFSGHTCTFFTRQPVVSMQVWSQDHGYPGDGDYLEFHKKDSDSGLRYWKVTDRSAALGEKRLYEPQAATSKVRSHAAHFVSSVSSLLSDYYDNAGQPGVVTAPFDAELFGHWWFEGVEWLEAVVELLEEAEGIRLAFPRRVLQDVRPKKTLMLPEGSWGQGGCHTMWYNKETAWMWQSIHKAERAMQEALDKRPPVASFVNKRILRQMGRELLLLQASDWQFLVTTGTAAEYAESRFRGHEENFLWLQETLESSGGDRALEPENLERLAAIEQKDRVFDSIKLSWFKERTENGL